MTDQHIVGWFEDHAAKLAQELAEIIGKPVEATVYQCPSRVFDGLHLKVVAEGIDYDDHVWEDGLSDFDIPHLEQQFQLLKLWLRSGRLRHRGGLAIVGVVEPSFVPMLDSALLAITHSLN